MKKLVLFVALSLSVAAAFAQKGLHAGVLFNPNSTWLINNDDSDFSNFRYQSTFGYSAGAHVNYHFTDGVGIGVEFLGMNQGQKFNTVSGDEFKKSLTYFKIPVLLVFNTNSESVVGFQAKLGPSFGILTGAKFTDENGDEVPFGAPWTSTLTQEQFKDAHKKLLISMVLEFGLAFNITENIRLDAGLRFDAGLTDPEDNKAGLRTLYGNEYNESKTWALNGGAVVSFYYILPVR